MDLIQIVIISVLIVLTLFLVVLGFQAFFTLRDFRTTLRRMNKLFDNTDDLVVEVKKPIESVGHMITAITAGAGIAHIIKKLEGRHERSEK